MRFRIFPLVVLLFFSFAANAQVTKTENDSESIKISTNLVQIDFLVTDKKGENYKNLKAEDVEIYQDGVLQKTVNFAYIENRQTIVEKSAPINQKNANVVSAPRTSATNSARNGRLITFVVDDNCMSVAGVFASVDTLKKFIANQMLPDDRVAIYQTKSGSSLFRQYTSDKEQLLRLVKNIKPNAFCGGISEPVTVIASEKQNPAQQKIKNQMRDSQTMDSIAVLTFVADRLKPLSGRKSVFVLSEGMAISTSEIPSGNVTDMTGKAFERMKELTNSALNSSVVFHAVDVRGVADIYTPQAADYYEGIQDNMNITDQTVAIRSKMLTESRAGLQILAERTGGQFLREKNSFGKEVEKVIVLENGYYLIGYQPDGETFEGKKFHKIEIKLKNPDLKIFSRNGFYGVTEKQAPPPQKSADSPIFKALASPLQETGIELKLTPLLINEAQKGNFVRSLLHVRGADLAFAKESNGNNKLSLDVVFLVTDLKGKLIAEINRTYKIQIPEQSLEAVKKSGLVYSLDIPIKEKGNYNVQVAVRDNNTNQIGSTGSYVEMIKPDNDDFSIAGLITGGVSADGIATFTVAKTATENFSLPDFNGDSALRKYRLNDTLTYNYTIYNAKNPKNLTTQLRIFKDGTLIFDGKETPLDINTQTDLARIKISSSLNITSAVQPADYVLQIIVRDKTTGKIVTNWMDFEVVN